MEVDRYRKHYGRADLAVDVVLTAQIPKCKITAKAKPYQANPLYLWLIGKTDHFYQVLCESAVVGFDGFIWPSVTAAIIPGDDIPANFKKRFSHSQYIRSAAVPFKAMRYDDRVCRLAIMVIKLKIVAIGRIDPHCITGIVDLYLAEYRGIDSFHMGIKKSAWRSIISILKQRHGQF